MNDKPRYYITDVFTTRKYSGNQLATFVNCESLSTEEMQAIAREINFSETTFIMSKHMLDGGFNVRIFTPKEEVPFAGHPTLGTAYIIREKIISSPVEKIILNLGIGKIPVTFSNLTDTQQLLWMQQTTPAFGHTLGKDQMAAILGLQQKDINPKYPILETSTGFPHIIVPLQSLIALKQIKINREAYFSLVNDAWAKIILAFVTEPYAAGQTLAVRVFADYFGVPEDAATGSGNGGLAAYLVHTQMLSTEIDIIAGQGYELGRPSELHLQAKEINGEIKVKVGGSVLQVAEGVWG